MQTKELYASVELAEDEIRLIVGELFMSRLNILKVLRVKTSGINNGKIVDKDNVSASIVKALFDVENALGFKIKNIILCIPSIDVKCVKRRVNVPISEGSRRIRKSHAKLGLSKAIESFNLEDHAFVNVGAIKYTNGGISSRSIPLDEQAEVLTMDIDLLFVDKDIVYSYVEAVEASGVQVLDICLDSYAIAEESAILENSMEKYIILCDFEKSSTNLSLFFKGRLIGSEELNYGYNRFIQTIKRKYHLSYKECLKLLKESSIYKESDLSDSIVYIYMEHDERKEITRKDLYECVIDDFKLWIKDINECNSPIVSSGDSKMVISGSGSDIVGLNALLPLFEADSSIYIPETIGARKGCFASTIGSIYVHNKWGELLNAAPTEIEYKSNNKRNIIKEEEKAFTTKLKNILLNK